MRAPTEGAALNSGPLKITSGRSGASGQRALASISGPENPTVKLSVFTGKVRCLFPALQGMESPLATFSLEYETLFPCFSVHLVIFICFLVMRIIRRRGYSVPFPPQGLLLVWQVATQLHSDPHSLTVGSHGNHSSSSNVRAVHLRMNSLGQQELSLELMGQVRAPPLLLSFRDAPPHFPAAVAARTLSSDPSNCSTTGLCELELLHAQLSEQS